MQLATTGHKCPSGSDSEPPTHFAFQFQIRLAEFFGEISLFPQDHSVMQNQSQWHDEQERDPVVQKKSERDLK